MGKRKKIIIISIIILIAILTLPILPKKIHECKIIPYYQNDCACGMLAGKDPVCGIDNKTYKNGCEACCYIDSKELKNGVYLKEYTNGACGKTKGIRVRTGKIKRISAIELLFKNTTKFQNRKTFK